MSNDTAVEFQPLVFAVDGSDIFFSVSVSEGWSLGANEIFSDLGFLHSDKGNVASKRGGYICTCPS